MSDLENISKSQVLEFLDRHRDGEVTEEEYRRYLKLFRQDPAFRRRMIHESRTANGLANVALVGSDALARQVCDSLAGGEVGTDLAPEVMDRIAIEQLRQSGSLFWRYLAPVAAALLLWVGIHLGIGAVEASPSFMPLRSEIATTVFSIPRIGDQRTSEIDLDLVEWLIPNTFKSASVGPDSCIGWKAAEARSRSSTARNSRNCIQCHRPNAI